MKRYNPKDIEPHWQQIWAEQGIYRAVDFDDRPKYVMLTEFPYPSGDGLHLGHIREYTYGDIMARQKRMQGYNVLFPMGYDAFGLPTENYAIKNKVSPQVATDTNVVNFQKQFESLGYSFDWSRSFLTSDPAYYRWTQWLFLQFFKAGLAYQEETEINWCPFCKTGLSNEEVVNGRHERCDTIVEKKLLKQWLLKITDYADKLIDGLQTVDFPPRIADQQINWIGRSQGAEINFYEIDDESKANPISVYTTRPDTIFGATFLVLAPEHPLVRQLTKPDHADKVNSYIKASQAKTDIERQESDREKTGVFTGAHAVNPLTGDAIPIWISDYVLAGYGTGAIMAVPAHDERDYEFAKKYQLEIIPVIDGAAADDFYGGPGQLVNSGDFNGLESEAAKTEIISFLEKEKIGRAKTQYRLRDWIFSRQRYWGEPIPIIHCPEHGAVAVPDEQLPVELPPLTDYEPTDDGRSPLSRATEWLNVTCPVCGQPAQRETDTMPNWAGSSWYYLRYFDAHNDQAFAARDKLDYWQQVDLYLGGMEHTTLHLLYSRFWHEFFYDQGLVPTPEPYAARRGQGIILAADGSKMSKSKGNVINPSEIIDSGYGADALRLAIAFLAPYDQTTPWSPEAVAGTHRFLQRVWTLIEEFKNHQNVVDKPNDLELEANLNRIINKCIKRVSNDLVNMGFNTAIAGLMASMNELYRLKTSINLSRSESVWRQVIETYLQLLAPFAPHISEELWQLLDNKGSIHIASWPQADEQYLIENSVTIIVQVNGKLRSQLVLPIDSDETQIVEAAKNDDKVAGYLQGQAIKKTIYVPNKLVNFVI